MSPRSDGRDDSADPSRRRAASPERGPAPSDAPVVRETVESALRLPARERLDLLLHAPKPMAVVRALPDAELYLTVREVGPQDALPLLALASPEQVQHLFDLESWRGERFDAKRSGAWAAVMLEAGEPALRQLLRRADDEWLALLFQQWLRVTQIPIEDTAEIHGPGETEAGGEGGFVAPDGHHRVSPVIPEHVPAARRLLQILFVEQPERYQQALVTALAELPSELEGHARHWRQSRLEEHGFPPWDEALAVYAPPARARRHPAPPVPERSEALAAPRAALRWLGDGGALGAALRGRAGEPRERTFHELASLANHLLVADAADPGDPDAHRGALRKAAGYIEIALAGRGARDAVAVSAALDETPLAELFREGYAGAVELQARALRLLREGWPAGDAAALELLDSPLRERVDALLQPRPGYLERSEDGRAAAARDFRSAAELDETRGALQMAETIGELFIGRLSLDVPRVLAAEAERAEPVRFSTLWLTLLAWHAVRGELRCEPLPQDATADFLRRIASRRTAAPDAPARALAALIDGLGERAALDDPTRRRVERFGKACLERLAAECGRLDPGAPADPRFTPCLLLESP